MSACLVASGCEAAAQAPARARALARWLRERLQPGAHLRSDSRAVRPGDAFLAWPGRSGDGRRHVAQAWHQGAAVVLREADHKPAVIEANPHPVGSAQDVVGLRALAGELASCYYGDPSRRLRVVAVTGTNGKTSCANWIAQGLSGATRPCAVIGTLGSGLVDAPRDAHEDFGLTTPDVLDLHRMLAGFVAQGATSVAMEASSIGLDQGRLDGVHPEVAVLTNLSRDHLDYHGSLEAYACAKLRLFAMSALRVAVLNAADPLSIRAAHSVAPGCAVIAYGEHVPTFAHSKLRCLRASRIEPDANGLVVDLDGDFGHARVRLGLFGRFNAINALAVASAWLALDMPFDQVLGQLERLEPVPGRLQRVQAAGGQALPMVLVDYAHTPDALEQLLQTLRPLASARGGALWCVFGAGGDRDPGKRAEMGAVAARWADRVVITSDNPRSEDPVRIAADIAAGMSGTAHEVQLDRERAIAAAVGAALAADVVVIAGKGHEHTQEVNGERLPFDDVVVAGQVLTRRAESVRA